MSAHQAAKTDQVLRKQREDVLANLTGEARKQVAASFAKAPHLWAEAFGSLGAKANDTVKLHAIVRALRASLPDVPSGLASKVTVAIGDAQETAVSHSLAVLPHDVKPPTLSVPAESKTAIKTLIDKSTHAMNLAQIALGQVETGSTFTAVTGALSNASASLNAIDAGTAYALQTGFTDAVTQVADAAGVGWVIVPERNACLDCNGYAGLTDQQTDDQPPFHPNCLCITQPWSPSWADKGEVSFPDALAREADRSVLTGASDYDSNAARVRAADRLLKSGVNAPASVKAKAQRAVKNSAFK